jgi:hypothetical protein
MTMYKSELIAVRDFKPEDDINFVLATWLRGLYYGDSIFSYMNKDTFMKKYKEVILNLIYKVPSTSVRIACLKEDPGTILGYVILSSPHCIHWVFVKKSWRKIGIARDLVPSSVNTVTHVTRIGLSIMTKKNWQFDPFII